jgi:hypothetical protein
MRRVISGASLANYFLRGGMRLIASDASAMPLVSSQVFGNSEARHVIRAF